MKLLALDTSSTTGVLALSEGGQIVVELQTERGIPHSQTLLPQIEQILALCSWEKKALEGIVVGVGPGFFTGLRVGIATAKGLAFALGCPLYGVNALDALALPFCGRQRLLVSCIDARKQEVYAALYRSSKTALLQVPEWTPSPTGRKGETVPPLPAQLPLPESPYRLLPPEVLARELASLEEDILLVGSGAQLYHDLFDEHLGERLFCPAAPFLHRLRGASLVLLGLAQAKEQPHSPPEGIEAVYLRPSEAELNIGPPQGGPPLKDRLLPDGTLLPPNQARTPDDS